MPRLTGYLFKFIQKQPPEVFIFYWCKKTEKVFLEISHKTHKENTVVSVSFLKFIKKETLAQLFSCKFSEISRNPFFQRTSYCLGDCCFFLLIFLSPSFHLFVPSQLQVPYTQCVCFTTQVFFMIAVAIFPVFYFLFLKLIFVSSLSFVLCSPFPSAD